MTSGILVFHIIVAALMIGIILIQRNEGGGLGMSSNSMSGIMTTRGTANLLTRVTGVLAATFFVTTIVLALLFKGAAKPKSLLDMEDKVPAPIHEIQDTRPVVSSAVTSEHTEIPANGDIINTVPTPPTPTQTAQ